MTPTKTIHVRVRSLADVANIVSDVERGYKGVFIQATAESLAEYLKISAPNYQYVSRARAYGMTGAGTDWGNMKPVAGYFSRKQFLYVMAKIAKDEITPGISRRTGATENGWSVKGTNTGLATIYNKEPGATWTMHDHWQARQPALAGWQKTSVVIEQNIDDAMVDGIDAVLESVKQKRGV